VAVILDACRYDLFESVEWDRPQSVEPIYSMASMTGDWMERTFGEGRPNTTYVTGAPFSVQKLDSTQLAELDKVWRYGFDKELGKSLQRSLPTEQSSTTANPKLGDRLGPYQTGQWESPWRQYYNGERSYDVLWVHIAQSLRSCWNRSVACSTISMPSELLLHLITRMLLAEQVVTATHEML